MANDNPFFKEPILYNCQIKTTQGVWLDKALTPSIALRGYRYETLPEEANITGPLFFKDPGLNIVSHETPSTLMIMGKQDSKLWFQTNKFLLQSITKPQQEKFQVIETFGKSHVYFYGERTRVYTIQGVLLDAYFDSEPVSVTDSSYKNMWTLGFQNFYDTELRGTRLIEENRIAALYVNGWLIKGYPISLTIMKEANQLPDATTFQMTWVIESELLLNAGRTKDAYSTNKANKDYVNLLNQKAAKLAEYQQQLAIVDATFADVTVTGDFVYMSGAPDNDVLNAAVKKAEALTVELRDLDKRIIDLLVKFGPKARKELNME
jgi:hypothetical protein